MPDYHFGAITDPYIVNESYEDWLNHPNSLGEFSLKGSAGPRPRRIMLWEVARKANGGKDTDMLIQQIGDCTSHATKNVVEYLQLMMIALGKPVQLKKVFPPFFYGCGRVLIGNQKGSTVDGATGAWMAKASMKYGILPTDTPNCPAYSGQVAKQWGEFGPPNNFIPIGQQHIVKATARITTLEAGKDALANYYPVSVCSNIGFDMVPRVDGLQYHSTRWDHNLTLLGYDEGEPDGSIPPHASLLNQWGAVHSQIIDFRTKEPWPVGTLRVPLATIGSMLAQNDSYAYSDMEVFESRELHPDFFRPW